MNIEWPTGIITLDRDTDTSIFSLKSGNVYFLDTNELRKALKDEEDGDEGMAWPDTHRHNTEVTLAGTTFARTLEIINGFTIRLTPDDGTWRAELAGSNNNVSDVQVASNTIPITVTNTGGLITSPAQTVPTAGEIATAVWSEELEGSFTAAQLMRLIASVLGGELTGAGSLEITIRDLSDTKPRLVVQVDTDGNRLSYSVVDLD